MSELLTGVPRIIGANTTASADDALAVLSSRDVWSGGEIAAALVRNRDEPLFIVIDPIGKRVYATSHAATLVELSDCVPAYSSLIVAPATLGLLSNWSVVSNDGFPDPSAFLHPANRKTLLQVVNAFCRDGESTFALIDQNTGQVHFRIPMSPAASSEDLADVPGAGFTVCFELAGKSTNRLIFE